LTWRQANSIADTVDNNPPTEVDIEMGAWFGEACLFNRRHIRTATFVAAAESELAVLPASEYQRIVQRYPRLLQRHRNIERALREGQLSITELAFKGKPSKEASVLTFRRGRRVSDEMWGAFDGVGPA